MKGTENTANPVVALAIGDMAMLPELQVRHKMDDKTINAYMASKKNGISFPLPKVAKIGGGYVLVDGWHRIEAMRRLGYPQVDVEIVAYSMEEAKACASTANNAHGLRLKKSEIRNALRLFIEGGRHIKGKWRAIKSYRDIAEELGGIVGYTTIRNWIEKDHPKVFKAMSKDDDENSSMKYQGGLRNQTVYGLDAPHRLQFMNFKSTCRTINDQKERDRIADDCETLANELRQGEIAMTPLPEYMPECAMDDF